MRKFAILGVMALLAADFGCTTGLRRGTYRRPQRKIDWETPISVMEGFFSAKKWGDWRTAYRCCDYDETLPRLERARIKKKWKGESKRWPLDYLNTFWAITDYDYDGETATLTISVSRRDPLTHEPIAGETYHEKLKKYKKKWKITSFVAPEARE